MKFLLIILTLICTNFAFAESSPVTELSNLSYICGNDVGGGFAVSVELEKVWQVDPDIQGEGLELNVTNFSLARCPHCMTINAELSFFGSVLDYQINISPVNGDLNDIKANVKVTQDNESETLIFDCVTQ